jgi:hypothetical protein
MMMVQKQASKTFLKQEPSSKMPFGQEGFFLVMGVSITTSMILKMVASL